MSGKRGGLAAFATARRSSPNSFSMRASTTNQQTGGNNAHDLPNPQNGKIKIQRPDHPYTSSDGYIRKVDRDVPQQYARQTYQEANDDPYATDIEHFDDTLQSVASNIQVLDSQVDSQGVPYARRSLITPHAETVPHSDMSEQIEQDDVHEDEEDEEDEEYSEHEDDTQRQDDFTDGIVYGGKGFDPHTAYQSLGDEYSRGRSNRPASISSYPTTTSGGIGATESYLGSEQGQLPHGAEVDNLSPLNSRLQSPAKKMHSQSRHSYPFEKVPQNKNLSRDSHLPQNQSPLRKRRSSSDLSASTHGMQFTAKQPLVTRSKTTLVDQPFASVTAGQVYRQPLSNNPQLPSPDSSTSTPAEIPRTKALSENRQHPTQDDESLDYLPGVLKSKAFADLAAEDFDYNPAHDAVIPPDQGAHDLITRLTKARSLESKEQRAFFSKMTLHEWEESGDWLLEQFGVILNKVKESRKKRRLRAAEFEKEVLHRHETVEKRKRDIEEALNDMRTSGSSVLHTPKRKKA